MKKPALLLIDYINEIVHPDGKSAGKGYPTFLDERGVLERVGRAAASARRNGVPVFLVRVGFSRDYREWPASSPLFSAAKTAGALVLGTWATEFHSAVGAAESDFTVTKHRVSAFHGTNLELMLRNLRVERLWIAGVATDLAVQSAAREAHDRDFEVVILEDLCGAADADEHEHAIAGLRKVATIAASADIDELGS